jgi:hypothetical protein
MASRIQSDESYVLDLCDDILDLKCERQARFNFLLGDAGKRGRRVRLPVDGYYREHQLVIEYLEVQHFEPVRHFDKPDRKTVSGVSRGEQRKIYDNRRREVLYAMGITQVDIAHTSLTVGRSGKLSRDRARDKDFIRRALVAKGVSFV